MKTLDLGTWNNCPEISERHLRESALEAAKRGYEAAMLHITLQPSGRHLTLLVLAQPVDSPRLPEHFVCGLNAAELSQPAFGKYEAHSADTTRPDLTAQTLASLPEELQP